MGPNRRQHRYRSFRTTCSNMNTDFKPEIKQNLLSPNRYTCFSDDVCISVSRFDVGESNRQIYASVKWANQDGPNAHHGTNYIVELPTKIPQRQIPKSVGDNVDPKGRDCSVRFYEGTLQLEITRSPNRDHVIEPELWSDIDLLKPDRFTLPYDKQHPSTSNTLISNSGATKE